MAHHLIELHYFPSVAYFAALQAADEIIIERHEHFSKQTYRNRCCINTAQGVQNLIVPVTSQRSQGKTLITEIRIDHQQKWVNNHWRTIQSAYGKSPFFEFYGVEVEQALFKHYPFLYDLNFHLLTICLKWLKWSKPIKESMAYQKETSHPIKDLRNTILAKKTNNQTSAGYFPSYTQVFGNTFVKNLSILDVIFCTGPQATSIVRETRLEHF